MMIPLSCGVSLEDFEPLITLRIYTGEHDINHCVLKKKGRSLPYIKIIF
jgi:hypothetical protein